MINKNININKRFFEEGGIIHTFLRKLFSVFVLLIALSACNQPFGSPECVEADDWGNIENIEITVHASERLTDAGIEVRAGEPLEIKVSGTVDLCSGDHVFRANEYDLVNSFGNPVTTMLPIRADINEWQRASYHPAGAPGSVSHVQVGINDKLSIAVSNHYFDRTGQKKESGQGLYAYIGPTAPTLPTDPDHNWWYGASGAPQPINNKGATDPNFFPEFFEIYDNGTLFNSSAQGGAGAGGFSGTAPQNGFLWFRYARTADARGLDDSGGDRYSPWLGEYAWDNPGMCRGCSLFSIATVCSTVGWLMGGYASCTAIYTASCAASGRLQEVSGAETGAGRKCREFSPFPFGAVPESNPGGDHWIDGAYDGSEGNAHLGNNPNSHGYEISIGAGCLGTFGEYLEMHIGEGNGALVEQFNPEGCCIQPDIHTLPISCTPVAGVCEVVTDGWTGQNALYVEYYLPASNATCMDLRPNGHGQCSPGVSSPPPGLSYSSADPSTTPHDPRYRGPGKFEGVVPASGELWFHIVDDQTSARFPTPGFYGDNFGEYKVKIKTTKVNSNFSDFAQNIIDPIKGLLFGYCRLGILLDPADPTSHRENPSIQQVDYSIDEAGCGAATYTDYNGNAVPAWKEGITKRAYHLLVGGVDDGFGNIITPFLDAVRAVLVLYVLLYGGMFMLGMVSDDQADFLKRILKVSLVAVLLSAGSWDFFNNYLFIVFTDGVDDLIFMLSGDFTGSSTTLVNRLGQIDTTRTTPPDHFNIFRFADITLDMLFNQSTWIKIAGLLFASPIGWIYIIMIIVGMFMFIVAVFKAIVLYLLAMIAIALLLIVAPIFIIFILFERTRPLFDGWIKNLINYMLQPVLVITALAIFNVFVFSAIYALLYYRVCWQTIWHLDFTIANFITVYEPLLRFYHPAEDPTNMSPTQQLALPIQAFMMLIYLIICSAMLKFVDWMSELSSELIFGSKVGSLANAAQNTFNKGLSVANMGAGIVIGAAYGARRGAKAEKGFLLGGTALGGAISGAFKGGNRGATERLGKMWKRHGIGGTERK